MSSNRYSKTAALFFVAMALTSNADASTRLWLYSNIADNQVFQDDPDLHVLDASYMYGRTLSTGFVDYGGLHIWSQVQGECDCSGPYSAAAAEFHDVFTVEPVSYSGTKGFLDITVPYHWYMSSQLGVGYSGSTNTGDISVTVNSNGFYAREYQYRGTSGGVPAPPDIRLPFVPLSDDTKLVSAVLGSYAEFLVPIEFGTPATVSFTFAVSSQAYGGVAIVDGGHSAYWGGMSALNELGEKIDFKVTSASGVDYSKSFVSSVPEPDQGAMLFAGFATLLAFFKRNRRHS